MATAGTPTLKRIILGTMAQPPYLKCEKEKVQEKKTTSFIRRKSAEDDG